jgi:asparagine synthase (glutamine-hydrolysing)
MCGIAGIISLNNQKTDEGTLIQMRDAMRHRGPDDEGIYINDEKTIAIGHRRLSIIDLSSHGHQPMSSEEGNIWITYNGEAYNFPELRQELKNLGYTFISNSDTEVILRAYQEWGEKAFEKLNGMFAFCIYDKRENLLYLVRDHAGIKPLYYSISNKHLIFSSEVKAFKIFNKDWVENEDWRIYFLIFGHIPELYTTLKDVYVLPKESFLRLNIKTGKYEIRKFIEINFTEKIKDEKEAIELVRNEFTKAVERHLISDAPIGVFLSGGIDSSLISLLASQFHGDNLRTLSVVFNEKVYSEEEYQSLVLKKIKSKHRVYLVTEKDFISSLDDIFSAMDQPTIDGVNTYFISKCAKEAGLKTVLSGLGGDELFGGYPSFNRIEKLWFYKPDYNRFNLFFKFFEHMPHNKLKKFSFLSLPSPLSYYLLFRSIFTVRETASLLNITEKEVLIALSQLLNFSTSELFNLPTSHPKNFMSALEANFYMSNQLLKDTDFMSMWHSVEVRVPFLDKEFMRLCFSIDEQVKFNRKRAKILLTKSFNDALPEEIILREKQGFTFPFDIWIRNNGRQFFDEAISKGSIGKNVMKDIWHRFENGSLYWSKVWACLTLSKWGK